MKNIIDKNEKVTANSKQVDILKKNFPNCFDIDGKFMPDKLTSIINDEVEISNESYELNWLGKKYARLLANQEVTTMLTEDIEHNSKPENINSENLYIEGDNLEVLKHMVNSYNNQIKMIYIDPPYNTGTDFIYKDDRKFTVEALSNLANVDEEEAQRILEFTESNSNSHSAWLTFIYPRLYIARELLSDDGVIFISIDDYEATQLKLLCDDIFGESNFLSNLLWKAKGGGADTDGIVRTNEYIFMYSKNMSQFNVGTYSKEVRGNKIDEHGRAYSLQLLRKWGSTDRMEDRPNLYYPITINDKIVYPIRPDGSKGRWRWAESRMIKEIELGNVLLLEKENEVVPYEKIYDDTKKVKFNNWLDNISNNAQGTKEIKNLFREKVFDTPKPTALIAHLLKMANVESEDLILDFFSGSASTAEAILKYNAEHSLKLRYIMVQINENINNTKSIAYKFCKEELNTNPTIPSIAKERIRRASELIKADNSNKEYIDDIDFGFKVFKTKPIVETNYFNELDKFSSDQTALLVTNDLSKEELSDLLLTWKLHDGIGFTNSFSELMLDDYIVHYVDDKAYFMYKGFTNRNIVQLLEELDDIESNFAVRNLIVFASNFTSKEQRELVEAVKGYKNKKKIELNIELRY